ncbi:SET and MYND domain-containing protein 5 [Fopius arisanus]|uniref:Protein-lysine N-trimethyltransferase SMYD5 n=1 Tax=Fopius arisanus TaxID=64838 RepID=A0A9R1T837_9HYME|nr:PREDICTED: SET and MYND domain-containing protein 5 [Fopius arisanus]
MSNQGYQVQIINEEKGKGLVALRSYEENETIFEEKPVVCCQFAWNEDLRYLACDNCLAPLETAEENARRLSGKKDLVLPYPECCETKTQSVTECPACGIKYCSEGCLLEASQKYHKILCLQSREKNENHPLVQLKETWKQMHYPSETATIMLLARMIAFVNQSEDKASALSIFNQFCHRTVNEDQKIAHNLLGEQFVGQIDVLREMMDNALNKENVPYWFTPDGFRSLLALVGTNGQGIGTSAFSRWAKNVSALELPQDSRMQVNMLIGRIYDDMEKVVGPFWNNEGSGLYSLQSSMNHSCLPNAIVEFPFSNSTLVVKALRGIQPGEEICIAYLDNCELVRTRVSRQEVLRSLYLFSCRCDRCLEQADDYDVSSEDDMCDEGSDGE